LILKWQAAELLEFIYNMGRKCAEYYNEYHNKFIFNTAISILLISNHNSFECCLIELLSYILFSKKYFIIGNG